MLFVQVAQWKILPNMENSGNRLLGPQPERKFTYFNNGNYYLYNYCKLKNFQLVKIVFTAFGKLIGNNCKGNNCKIKNFQLVIIVNVRFCKKKDVSINLHQLL